VSVLVFEQETHTNSKGFSLRERISTCERCPKGFDAERRTETESHIDVIEEDLVG
jgi:hypothetical protein